MEVACLEEMESELGVARSTGLTLRIVSLGWRSKLDRSVEVSARDAAGQQFSTSHTFVRRGHRAYHCSSTKRVTGEVDVIQVHSTLYRGYEIINFLLLGFAVVEDHLAIVPTTNETIEGVICLVDFAYAHIEL